jgi:predicted dehydrogenase
MNRQSLKQAARRFLLPAVRGLGDVLSPGVREELLGHWAFHQMRRRGRAPYWERRQPPEPGRSRVRLGFVGAGRYAQNHLKALHALDGVELAALLTTGGPRAQKAAAEFGIGRVLQNADEFFALPGIDAYVVVVPPEFIKGLSLKALRTGKPVLLEKPPGVGVADAEELVACAAQHGTFGMVCMNRRFYSVLEHGLAHLAECGPIRGMIVETPQQVTLDRQSGRVSAFDHEHYFARMSIHGVDLVRYVLGDPARVHSLARPNAEFLHAGASYAAILEYPRGVVATVTDLWDTPHVWRVKIVAEQGWLELEPLEHGLMATAAREVHGGCHKAEVRVDPVDVEFRAGVYAQDLAFVEAVRAGKPPSLPACLLPDAVGTMKLMERIQAGTLNSA